MTDIRDTKIYNNFIAKFDQHIILDDNGEKQSLINQPKGWQNLKKDITTRNAKNVGIVSGKFNNFVCLDLDIEKKGKKSGMEWFINNFGAIENFNTLLTKSIRGGIHLYVKYSKELINGNGVITGYNVDIKSTDGFVWEGKDYNVIKETSDLMKPDFLVEYFKNKNDIEKFEKDTKIKCDLKHKDEVLCDIVNLIDKEFFTEYESWIRIMMGLKNIGASEDVFYTLTELYGTEQ